MFCTATLFIPNELTPITFALQNRLPSQESAKINT
jgi:hypothetical protein